MVADSSLQSSATVATATAAAATPAEKQLKTEIRVADDVVFTVTVNQSSGKIYKQQMDLASMGGAAVTALAPFELGVLLKGYSEVAVTTYVCFLRGFAADIIDRPTMTGCLQIYSKTGDLNFFKHVLQQLFRFWTILSPILYENGTIPPKIKDEVWQHCPKQVLPQAYLDYPLFMRVWSAGLNNKHVKLNGEESFNQLSLIQSPESQSSESQSSESQSSESRTEEELTDTYSRASDGIKISNVQRTYPIQQVYYTTNYQLLSKGHQDVLHGLFTARKSVDGLQTIIYLDDGERARKYAVSSSVRQYGSTYGPEVKYRNDRLTTNSYSYASNVLTRRTFFADHKLESHHYEVIEDSVEAAYRDTFRDDTDNSLKTRTITRYGDNWQRHELIAYDADTGDYTTLSKHAGNVSYHRSDGRLFKQMEFRLGEDKEGSYHHLTSYDESGAVISVVPINDDAYYEEHRRLLELFKS